MIPTDEQIKELWDRCGFYKSGYWQYSPERRSVASIYNSIPINLTNLFRWAVPREYQQIIFQSGYCGITIDDKLYEGSGNTEEEALFWALWEVLK